MNKELMEKIIEKVYDLCLLSERDLMIYGNSYFEFGERKIELIDPKKVKIILDKNGKIKNKDIVITGSYSNKKLYGKSILEKKWK